MAAARFVGNGVADMLRDSCAYGALTFHLLLNGLMRQKQGCLTRDKTASFPLICCRQRLMNPTGLRANLQEHTYTARDTDGHTWTDSLLLVVSTLARASANTLSSRCSII